MRHGLALLLIWMLALPARSQDAMPRLDAALDQWQAQNGATGILATGPRDAQGDRAVARTDAHKAMRAELASVGKSITAIRVLSLVGDGRLDCSDRLPDVPGEAPGVSIAEPITHASGLGPNSTQAAMRFWLDAPADAGHDSAQMLDMVNARDGQGGTVGDDPCNNENRALPGLVIEAVSGEPHATYCPAALGLPASLRPSPRSGAMLPWGAFVVDPADFPTFPAAHFGPDGVAGVDPFALPHADTGGGASYGMGMVVREFRGSFNFWHFGALCFPGRLNMGSYAVLWKGEVGAMAIRDACADLTTMQALDAAPSRAVYL